jgi:hypothetical protein
LGSGTNRDYTVLLKMLGLIFGWPVNPYVAGLINVSRRDAIGRCVREDGNLLLLALWVRSFQYLDSVQLPWGSSVSSVRGRILVDRPVGFAPTFPDEPFPTAQSGITSAPLNFFSVTFGSGGAALPMWSLILLSAILMSAFWFPERFSLRTLLMATTLVAVGLGLIMWAAK